MPGLIGDIAEVETLARALNLANNPMLTFANAMGISPSQAVSPLYGGVFYAAQAGVTGINTGSRDDGVILRQLYTWMVAQGYKLLVLPQGNVYFNSHAPDASYPNDYGLRVDADDFIVYAPPGCTIIDTVTSGGNGGTFNDTFQFTGNRSFFIGGPGSLIKHASPGQGNNLGCAIHITAPSDMCGVFGVSTHGFASTTLGSVDNSSSNRAFLKNIRAQKSVIGIMQSSTASTVRCVTQNCEVIDFYAVGLSLTGYDNQVANILIDNTASGNDATQVAGFRHNGALRFLDVNNVHVYGDTSNAGAGAAYQIAPSSVDGAAHAKLNNISGRWMNQFLHVKGAGTDVVVEGYSSSDCTNGVYREGANGRIYLRSGKIRGSYNSMLAAAASTGDIYVDGLRIENQGQTATWNGATFAGTVAQVNNITSDGTNSATGQPSLAQRKDIQRVASAASVTATAGVNNLTTILTGTTNTALTLPSSPFDGQVWTLRSEGAIATFSFSGGTVAGAPAALTAGYSRTFIYDTTSATWT